MFDLPSVSSQEMKDYRLFRRFLMKNGFIMMQESIYTKLALNPVVAKQVRQLVVKNVPEKGLIQMLTITEKQFAEMELLIGDAKSIYLATQARLVIL